MSKILVKDLREALNRNKKEDVKTVDFNGLQLEIKQYLTISEKLTLIKSIFESAIDRDNGLHILNGNSLDIAYRVLLVQTYTNLTLPKNIVESYDMLVSSGLYDTIYNNIPDNEILDIQMLLNNHIDAEKDEYEQKNTIQYIIKDLLSGLIDKLPSKEEAEEFIKKASEEINNMNPDNLKFVQDFLKSTKGDK